MAKTQGQLNAVPMDKVNPHYNSKYASLPATQEVVRAPMAENGLAIIHLVTRDENGPQLVSMLTHSSGQWIRANMRLLLDKQNMQGLGSAITYGKRQAVQALLNIAGDEDDDGNGAAGKQQGQNKPPQQQQQRKPQGNQPPKQPQNQQKASPPAQPDPKKTTGATAPQPPQNPNANPAPKPPPRIYNTAYGSITSAQKNAIQEEASLRGIDLVMYLDPRNLDSLSEQAALDVWKEIKAMKV